MGVASYSLTETAQDEYSDTLLAPGNGPTARSPAHPPLRTTRLSEFSDTLLARRLLSTAPDWLVSGRPSSPQKERGSRFPDSLVGARATLEVAGLGGDGKSGAVDRRATGIPKSQLANANRGDPGR